MVSRSYPRGRVSRADSESRPADREADDTLWIRAGRELGARWVLTGSFQRAGGAVRVTASLLDVPTGRAARTVKVDSDLTEIFPLQDRLGCTNSRPGCALLRARRRPSRCLGRGVVGAYEAQLTRCDQPAGGDVRVASDRAVSAVRARSSIWTPAMLKRTSSSAVAYRTKADYLAMGELRERAVASLRRGADVAARLDARAHRELRSGAAGHGVRTPKVHGASSVRWTSIQTMRASWAQWPGRFHRSSAVRRSGGHGYERALESAIPRLAWLRVATRALRRPAPRFLSSEAAARRAIALQQASLSGQEVF